MPFWKKIRADFPITKKSVYLDHAAGGPIPKPVWAKIQSYYKENFEEADFAWMKWVERREKARAAVAKFINAEPEEIAFISSTSQGMNLIAEMIAPEGEVLINRSEFPSSTVPWVWRSAKITWQDPEENKIKLNTMGRLLKPSIKTIVSSFVQYSTGFRQDMGALGKMKKGRYLVVNATQGFGALPIDVKEWNADFLCTNSYKWFMAGYGGGVLYIKKKWLSKFKPSSLGWRSMKNPEAMDNRKIDIRNDAGRYELGCPPFPNIFAVGAAAEYFTQIGMEKIEKRILELTDFSIQRLKEKGFEVLSPLEKKHRSGIVIFKAKNPQTLWKKLLAEKVYVSARGGGIRLAPHFYNSMEEIDRMINAVCRLGGR